MISELPLFAFTVLTTAAVGASLGLGLLGVGANKAKTWAIGASVLTFAGIVCSFFHLGNPVNAVYAFNNIGSSWMSREIALAVILLVIQVIAAVVACMKNGGSKTIRLSWAAAIAGVLLIIAQAASYATTSVSGWAGPLPGIGFSATAFAGILVMSVALMGVDGGETGVNSGAIAIAAGVVTIVAAVCTLSPGLVDGVPMTTASFVLVVVGAFCGIVSAVLAARASSTALSATTYAVALAGMVLIRAAFYLYAG